MKVIANTTNLQKVIAGKNARIKLRKEGGENDNFTATPGIFAVTVPTFSINDRLREYSLLG